MTNNPISSLLPADALKNLKKGWVPARPVIRPIMRVSLGSLGINLYVAQRKLPFLIGHTLFMNNALLVPVAPDLKMVFGVAKQARDWGADIAQNEALKVAPLKAGEAFVGTGGRYRFRHTVLAVIFDEQKRTSPDIIRRAVRRGAQLASERGATSLILPDMTENLLAQPNWITDAQRAETAQITAFTLVDTLRSFRNMMKTVNIWCWDPRNVEFYLRELKRLQA
jgi:O-acetyl-ADP-ribose deacetylase (regulator of RNase III)